MLHMCHVPQHREDNETGQEACETVDGAGQHCVSVAVVVELVVAGQSQKSSEPRTQREEYLRCSIYPYLDGNKENEMSLNICYLKKELVTYLPDFQSNVYLHYVCLHIVHL